MQKREIANTGMLVSVLGLGTVKFGRNTGVKYPEAFSLPTDKEIEALLSLAYEQGINLLDTAPAYGSSEERLGKALRGRRHEFVLSTKAGEEFIDGVSQFDFSRQALNKSVERSLKRLHTDYLDVLLVHSNGEDEKIIERDQVFLTLEKLKADGKIRSYGMSTKTVAGGYATLHAADIAMVSFSPAYLDEREVLQKAHELKKSVFVKKAFGSGHHAEMDALRFILAEPGVTSVIVGTLNGEHLLENVRASVIPETVRLRATRYGVTSSSRRST